MDLGLIMLGLCVCVCVCVCVYRKESRISLRF